MCSALISWAQGPPALGAQCAQGSWLLNLADFTLCADLSRLVLGFPAEISAQAGWKCLEVPCAGHPYPPSLSHGLLCFPRDAVAARLGLSLSLGTSSPLCASCPELALPLGSPWEKPPPSVRKWWQQVWGRRKRSLLLSTRRGLCHSDGTRSPCLAQRRGRGQLGRCRFCSGAAGFPT